MGASTLQPMHRYSIVGVLIGLVGGAIAVVLFLVSRADEANTVRAEFITASKSHAATTGSDFAHTIAGETRPRTGGSRCLLCGPCSLSLLLSRCCVSRARLVAHPVSPAAPVCVAADGCNDLFCVATGG